MYKDISIAFSGHNIKLFAVLAIESFLTYYPDMRENIVYFDDDSTDGTREELENRGINVITWSPGMKQEYQNLINTGIISEFTHKVVVRVCYIMRDMLEQINTKYVLISDGDVVFKRGNFIEEYMEQMKGKYRLITMRETSVFNKAHADVLKGHKYEAFYGKYMKPQNDDVDLSTPRVHLLHTFMDLEYFKSIDLVLDCLEPEILQLTNGGLLDTGTDFYYRITDKKIPVLWLDRGHIWSIIHHWCWLSSANRDDSFYNNQSYRNFENEMRKAIYDNGLEDIIRKTGIHPMRLIKSFNKSKGQSNIEE